MLSTTEITDMEKSIHAHESEYPGAFETCTKDYIGQIDSMVGTGETIRICEPDLSLAVYGDPRLIEAFLRATKPWGMLSDHHERGTAMATEFRYDAALLDFNHAAMIVLRLGLKPKTIHEEYTEEQQRNGKGMLGSLFNNYGYCLMQKGRHLETIPLLERSLSFHPGQVFAHNNLGDCYREMGMLREAIGQYQEELRINPNHPTARQSLDYLSSLVPKE